MDLVLDASVVVAWILRDQPEGLDYAHEVLAAGEAGAVFFVPYIFEAELAAGTLRAVRRRALTIDTLNLALDHLDHLPVRVVHTEMTTRYILNVATAYHLQAYDAIYFDLARGLNLPIATLDGGLRTAARSHGVKLFDPA